MLHIHIYDISRLRVKEVNEGLQTEGSRRLVFVILGFRHEVAENCALMGYHTASSGNFLPKFRDNMSIRNYHCTLRNNAEDYSSQETYILARRYVQNIP